MRVLGERDRSRSYLGSRLTPTVEHPLDLVTHALASDRTRKPRHQQLVVAGVLVANGGDYSELERARIKRSAGRAAPYPALPRAAA